MMYDSPSEYDHGLIGEHPPGIRAHKPYKRQAWHSFESNSIEGDGDLEDDSQYMNGLFRHAACFNDHDCCSACTCEVTDSARHVSQCIPAHLSHRMNAYDWRNGDHEALHGVSDEDNE